MQPSQRHKSLTPTLKRAFVTHRLCLATEQQLRLEPLTADLFVTACGYFRRAAWHSLPTRTLDEHVLIYCLEGTGWLRLQDRILRVVAGDIFICPAGAEHGYGAQPAQPWSILWLHFSGQAAAHTLTLLGWNVNSLPVNIGRDEAMIGAFHSMLSSYAQRDDVLAGLEAAGSLHQVIARWLVRRRPEPRIPREIQRVLRAVAEDCAKAYSVEDLALLAGWSPSYFARSFQRILGKSPIDYLVRLRVKRASDLLVSTRDSVGSIAQQVGYEDAFYFSRLFRKITGLSPREFRRTLGGAGEKPG